VRGREQRGGAKPFSISQRDGMGAGGPQRSAAFGPPLVSITARGFWQGDGERRERETETPWLYLRLQRPLCATPRSSFILETERERKRETRTSNGGFDLRSTRAPANRVSEEAVKKENIRGALSGTPGREVPESVQRSRGGPRRGHAALSIAIVDSAPPSLALCC